MHTLFSDYVDNHCNDLITPYDGDLLIIPATVRYIYYSFQHRDLVGTTVVELRRRINNLWSCPLNAQCYLGICRLPDNYIIQSNDNLEFIE